MNPFYFTDSEGNRIHVGDKLIPSQSAIDRYPKPLFNGTVLTVLSIDPTIHFQRVRVRIEYNDTHVSLWPNIPINNRRSLWVLQPKKKKYWMEAWMR